MQKQQPGSIASTRPSKGRRAIAIGVGAGVLLVVAAIVLWPRPKPDPARNLSRIGAALFIYGREHGGRYPADLATLASQGYLTADVLRHSGTGQPFDYFGGGRPLAEFRDNDAVASEAGFAAQGRGIAVCADGTTMSIDGKFVVWSAHGGVTTQPTR